MYNFVNPLEVSFSHKSNFNDKCKKDSDSENDKKIIM